MKRDGLTALPQSGINEKNLVLYKSFSRARLRTMLGYGRALVFNASTEPEAVLAHIPAAPTARAPAV